MLPDDEEAEEDAGEVAEPPADDDELEGAGGRLALPSAGTLMPPSVAATVPFFKAEARVPGPGCATRASSAGVEGDSGGSATPQQAQTGDIEAE